MTTWIKLHNNFFRNPKVLAAGEDAALLYIQGLVYCSDSLTDGAIPTPALRTLTTKKDARTLARALVREGLWVETATGWAVHDYLKVQRSRADVEQHRERAARRQALHRNPSLREAIKERDEGKCQYCGVIVDWADRRGPSGGTYDHVDPDGPDDETNLVVACRACNGGKRDNERPHPRHAQVSENEPKTSLPDTDAVTETDPPLPPLLDQIVDLVFTRVMADKERRGERIVSVDGFRQWWDDNELEGCRKRAAWFVENYDMPTLGHFADATRSPSVPPWASPYLKQRRTA